MRSPVAAEGKEADSVALEWLRRLTSAATASMDTHFRCAFSPASWLNPRA